MEIIEEAFAKEAVRQLAFLTAIGGYTGPEVERAADRERAADPERTANRERAADRETAVSVSYRRGAMTLEASLVIGPKGKRYAVITGITDLGEDGVERRELARDPAGSDSRMRRALKMQAKAVRRTMV